MRRARIDGVADGTKRARGASLEAGFGFHSRRNERAKNQPLTNPSRGLSPSFLRFSWGGGSSGFLRVLHELIELIGHVTCFRIHE